MYSSQYLSCAEMSVKKDWQHGMLLSHWSTVSTCRTAVVSRFSCPSRWRWCWGRCTVCLFLHAVCYFLPSGFLVIMHPSQMFMPEVKSLYNGILADSASSINLKIQILKNLQTYLQEEDTRMQEADRECKHYCSRAFWSALQHYVLWQHTDFDSWRHQ